jgi:acyl-CoA synthetase (AMP-forming)/AMP-acid ligase II
MRTGLTIGPPEDIAMTIEALGAAQLCNVYGSTETYGNCAVTDADDPLALSLHSQGLPLPGMMVRVVDPVTRRPLPEGELAVRGYVTPGYYRAPELDTEAFDRDGYFLTGDLCTIEADGPIRFRGRLKELIKTGGVNVAPLEVEQVLLHLLQRLAGQSVIGDRGADLPLTACTAEGLFAAIISAVSIAQPISSLRGTSRFTRPSRAASPASIKRAVSSRSIA